MSAQEISRHKIPCQYCGGECPLVPDIEVYGRTFNHGYVYHCRHCNAWVGVHEGTTKPKGEVANKRLREWRIKAHAAFDPIWDVGSFYKRKARRILEYHWLALSLGISHSKCHIGMFDEAMCRRVVEVCLHRRGIAVDPGHSVVSPAGLNPGADHVGIRAVQGNDHSV